MKLILLPFVIFSLLMFIQFIFRRIKRNRFRFKGRGHADNNQDRLPKSSFAKEIRPKLDEIRNWPVKVFFIAKSICLWVIYIAAGFAILVSLLNDGGEDLLDFFELVVTHPFLIISLIIKGLISLMGPSRMVVISFIAIFILWRIFGTKKKNLNAEQPQSNNSE